MSELLFDPVEHKYSSDGRHVPNVTSILSCAGLINSDWFTEESCERGRAVHLACQYLDDGELDFTTVAVEYLPYIKAYQKFLEECKPEWRLIEYRIFDKKLWYAGTLDREGIILGKNSVVDIKSGVLQEWTGVQCRAYQRGLNKGSAKCYGLQLKNNGTYKLHLYDSKEDFMIFRCALNIYNWKRLHGGI